MRNCSSGRLIAGAMTYLCIGAVSIAILNASCLSQQPPNAISSSGEDSPAKLAAQLDGTDLVAELSHSLDAKKVKAGDVVKAALTQDVLAHGKIVVPRGSKLIGRVTEVRLLSKNDHESRLGIVFDKAVIKGGREISFNATIRALAPAAPMNLLDAPDPMSQISPVSGNGPQPIGTPVGRQGREVFPANSASHSGQMPDTTAGSHSSDSGSGERMLSGGSRGVFGLPGLQLSKESRPEYSTVIFSVVRNVKLEARTQIVIQVDHPAP